MRYLSCIFIVSSIFTLPSGSTVKSGSVQFSSTGSTQLEITTMSLTAEVDWDSFSIGATESVLFHGPHPTTSYVIVNRVLGGTKTSHLGQIQSSSSYGTVILVNESGIVFGANSSTYAGCFYASTLDLISDISNPELTFEGSSTKSICISGAVNSSKGDVIILSNQVIHDQSGSITAVGGARMASGHKVLVKQNSTSGERIFIQYSDQSPLGPNPGVGVDVAGTIEALETEIKADGCLYALAIQHKGTIQASGCTTLDGRILLQADPLDTSKGTISIEGGNLGGNNTGCSNGEGPTIDIIGPIVTITNTSKIDASGNTKGGKINIHDRNTTGDSIASLSISTDNSSQLLANACFSGDGGDQTFWADSATLSSSFEARPLTGTGNGGSITSTSTNYLGYNAQTTNLKPFSSGSYGILTLIAPYMHAGSADLRASGSQVFQSSLNDALDRANVVLNVSSGNLNVINLMSWTSATTLNLIASDVFLGLESHSHAYSSGFSGTNATIVGSVENSFGVYAGAGASNDALLLGSSVSIDSQSSGGATLTVEASACCDAYIDTTSGITKLGQSVPLNSVFVTGSCCNNGNMASIGSKTGSSDIQITASESIVVNGGSGIADNTASIESAGSGTFSFNAKNFSILAGSDLAKTGNFNHAYVSTTGDIFYSGCNFTIKGAQQGLNSSKGYMQATNIAIDLLGNLEIKGGGTNSSQAYMQGSGNIDITTVGNIAIIGGLDHYADAFINSTGGNITIDNHAGKTGTLTISVPITGTCNSQSYIQTNNGNIHIGQNHQFDGITLNAGACGVTPVTYIGVTGTGDVKASASNQLNLFGGGQSEVASHSSIFTNNGNINLNSDLDANIVSGTDLNSHAYVEAKNGTVAITVGRNLRLEGSCTIPNYAYIQSSGNDQALDVTVGNNIYLVGNAYFSSQNKDLSHGGQMHVLSCSSPVNPSIPSSSFINTLSPGDYYNQYISLHEIFYRMRYFYPFPFFEEPYFNYANYISP